MAKLEPEYRATGEVYERSGHPVYEPVYPCRVMHTRHCPAVYRDTCGDRPCARFESNDEAPWLPEVDGNGGQ